MIPHRLVRALPAVLLLVAARPSVSAATFTVTTVADSGPGSLRTAIDQANANAGADRIEFNIPGPAPHVIELDSQLPHVEGDGTEIHGETQPGYVDRPVIALNGVRFGLVPFSGYRGGGIIIFANECVVQGLAFGGFRAQLGQDVVRAGWHEYDEEHSCAVRLHGNNNVVRACHFGCDTTGQATQQGALDAGNLTSVLVKGRGARVEQCLFALNYRGAWLFGPSAEAFVTDNSFGLLRDGVTPAVPPMHEGRAFKGTGLACTAAGLAIVDRNVFAGLVAGITLEKNHYTHEVTRNTSITRSTFGLGRSGQAVGIGWGVEMFGCTGVEIGQFDGSPRPNYFCLSRSFSYLRAVGFGQSEPAEATPPCIMVAGESEATIAWNVFGENAAGEARPNDAAAVLVTHASYETGPSNLLIRGNAIAHGGKGIVTQRRSLQPQSTVMADHNTYRDLGGMAIDNGDDGPTAPDALDADTGPSGLQNQPVLDTASYDAGTGQTTVSGRLNAFPHTSYVIEVFSAPLGSISPPEGHVVQARPAVVTDALGNALFSATVPGLFTGQIFTATATPNGAFLSGTAGTSELADPLRPPSGSFRVTGGGALTEGSGVTRTLTVTRTGTYGPASVQLVITGAAAGAKPADYVLSEGPVLAFANGEASKTITVAAVDDALDEDLDFFTVTLANVSNALSVGGTAFFSVTDNDAPPTLSAADVSVTEGQTPVVQLQLSAASEKTITVGYDWLNGTARSGADYSSTSPGTLTFTPGMTQALFSALTTDDLVPEPTEDFFLVFFLPTNATVADPDARISIVDNDLPDAPPATGFRFFTLPFSTDEAGFLGSAFVTLERTGSLTGSASVKVSTQAGSAGAADYTPLAGQEVVFGDGEQFKTIALSLTDDALDEDDESFALYLSDPSATVGAAGLGDPATLPITLLDNDAPPKLKLGTVTRAEGSLGVSVLEVPVSLTAPSGRMTALQISVTGGTATVGPLESSDCQIDAGATYFLPAGFTSGTLTVGRVNGDRVNEPDETIELTPVAVSGLGTVTGGTITLQNDDSNKPTFELTGVPATVTEAVDEFEVTLVRHGDIAVTATCRVKAANAAGTVNTVGEEYSFASGEESKTVRVRVRDNARDEPDVAATLVLQPTAPGEAPVSIYPFTIVDDDEAPVVNLGADLNVDEQDGSDTTVNVAVSLSAPSGFTVTVPVTSVAGTAAAGTDFVSVAGLLTFAPGEVTKNVSLTIKADRTDEPDETLSLILGGPTHATVGNGVQQITIIDNDTPLRPYRDWLVSHFTPEERRSTVLTTPCNDADGDGLDNVLEFYLDSDPRDPHSGQDRFALTAQPDALVWSFVGLASRAAFVDLRIEESPDLHTWSLLTTGTDFISEFAPDGQQHKVLANFIREQTYFRLRGACRNFEPEP